MSPELLLPKIPPLLHLEIKYWYFFAFIYQLRGNQLRSYGYYIQARYVYLIALWCSTSFSRYSYFKRTHVDLALFSSSLIALFIVLLQVIVWPSIAILLAISILLYGGVKFREVAAIPHASSCSLSVMILTFLVYLYYLF